VALPLSEKLENSFKKKIEMSMYQNSKKEDIINAFQFRHADQRVLTPQKTITDDDIKFILETAHLSPSSFGFEPWYFIVVQDAVLV
jgi:DNA-binding transcriptional regulator YiaG